MSKQLAISAAFSIFAMAAFALFASPLESLGHGTGQIAGRIAGGGIAAEASADLWQMPALPGPRALLD